MATAGGSAEILAVPEDSDGGPAPVEASIRRRNTQAYVVSQLPSHRSGSLDYRKESEELARSTLPKRRHRSIAAARADSYNLETSSADSPYCKENPAIVVDGVAAVVDQLCAEDEHSALLPVGTSPEASLHRRPSKMNRKSTIVKFMGLQESEEEPEDVGRLSDELNKKVKSLPVPMSMKKKYR